MAVTMLDEHAFLALNALYVKKMASAGDLAEITGLPADRVRAMVSGFAERGWLLDMGDQLLLQPDGTEQVLDYYRQAYSSVREQETVVRWYERFEAINSKFIKLVTEWQQSDGDPRAQERVIRVVEQLSKAIGELVALIPRYAGYVRRFEHSMTQVDEGQRDFVCNPRVDSLHNIWFEFHEDLLTVLGRPRDT